MPPKKCYLDDIIRVEKKKIGPQQYAQQIKWSDDCRSVLKHGHSHKDEFSKHDRVTVTSEYITQQKRKGVPAPGTYDPKRQDRLKFGKFETSEKSTFHIDMAVYYSKQTPALGYKNVDSLLQNPAKKQAFAYKFPPTKTTAADLSKKIPKSDKPDVGTYQSQPAYKYTLPRKGHSQKWTNTPKTRFYDFDIKRSKEVPGAGTYKVQPNVFKQLSRSPPSIAIRRH